MRLETCEFLREENAPVEQGVLINEGDLILDAEGKPVPKCWTWNRTTSFAIELFDDKL